MAPARGQMYHLLRANAASSPGSVRAALVAILPRLAATGWMLSEACPADTLREDLLQLHSFAMQFLAQHEVSPAQRSPPPQSPANHSPPRNARRLLNSRLPCATLDGLMPHAYTVRPLD